MNIFKRRFIFHWIIWLLLFILFAVCGTIIIFVAQEQEYTRDAKRKRTEKLSLPTPDLVKSKLSKYQEELRTFDGMGGEKSVSMINYRFPAKNIGTFPDDCSTMIQIGANKKSQCKNRGLPI